MSRCCHSTCKMMTNSAIWIIHSDKSMGSHQRSPRNPQSGRRRTASACSSNAGFRRIRNRWSTGSTMPTQWKSRHVIRYMPKQLMRWRIWANFVMLSRTEMSSVGKNIYRNLFSRNSKFWQVASARAFSIFISGTHATPARPRRARNVIRYFINSTSACMASRSSWIARVLKLQ